MPRLLRKSDLATLLVAIHNGGGSASHRVVAPDILNRTAYLTSDGTWTAYADGFIQRDASVNKPSTAYATFTLTINGVVAWAVEYAGLLSTGLYSYTSPPLAVLAGDVITTASNGSNITSTLYFMPPRTGVA